ncbi:protein nen4 [Quercus suber]|uniref:Protein nen4 n=1 Tax=Quercus suber TaxID=58331 RepID=A0AAW0L4W2_QUESU
MEAYNSGKEGMIEIVFFDLETNVPNRAGQRFWVLEFGAIVVCPQKLVELESYSTLIRPKDLFRCDGITRAAVANAPSFEQVADKIFSILNGRMASLATYFGLGQQKHRSLDDARMNLEVLKHCATVLFLKSPQISSIGYQKSVPYTRGSLRKREYEIYYAKLKENKPLTAYSSILTRCYVESDDQGMHVHPTLFLI